jgi:L-aminopeptidase/D-esterase-like protein
LKNNNTLTAIEGLRVGHAEDRRAGTGCTVVLLDPMVDVACEARGGYPTTFDTHGIDVAKRFVKRHAIFLAGGDVYGLDSPIGIRKYLLERGLASNKAGGQMPLIVGATIYDMWRADIHEVNYGDLAYKACLGASTDPVAEGNVGGGIGGLVGSFTGHDKSGKGGVGTFAQELFGGVYVAALIVTNSMGNIRDPDTGETIAGARNANGRFVEFDEVLEEYVRRPLAKENTTIGVVATNADLNQEELVKICQMAHDGLPMSIRPTHTTGDGDTIFAVSTARVKLKGEDEVSRARLLDAIGYLSAKCVAVSIARSVQASSSSRKS